MPRAGCGQTRGARIASRAATRKWTSIDPEASCVVEMRCARSTWSPSARSGVSSRPAPPVTFAPPWIDAGGGRGGGEVGEVGGGGRGGGGGRLIPRGILEAEIESRSGRRELALPE